MTQYIDKSALVAEIERRKNICKKVVLDLRTEENKDYYQGKTEAYKEALDFLDTLEVKDLELSWEDMRIILNAENDILRECNSQKELVIETYPKGEDYYGEILKRFKHFKERKGK